MLHTTGVDRPRSAMNRGMKTQTPTSSDIRAWARGAGLEVGDRGRLSPAVLDAYNKAHGGSPVKVAAKKAPAKRAPAKKAPAKRAASKATARKSPAKKSAVRNGPASSAPTRTAAPREAVQHQAPAAAPAPVVSADSELIVALENQVKQLATRVERLEEARAALASQSRGGLFRKKG